jgi:hypothetical protein
MNFDGIDQSLAHIYSLSACQKMTDLVGHHHRDHGNKINKNTMVTTNLDRERWRPYANVEDHGNKRLSI